MGKAEICLEEVLGAFDFGDPVVGAIRYGQGHINEIGRASCRERV